MGEAAVTTKDLGYSALVKRVFGIAGKVAAIEVGVLEGEGAKVHDDKTGTTILEIALANEFGTDTIPERSFIRAWIDGAEPELREKLAILMRQVLAGERDQAEILELMGLYCVGEVQKRIAAGIDPPNAPSTIARKGSSTPLIDTGVLRSSITHQVTFRGAHAHEISPGSGGGGEE